MKELKELTVERLEYLASHPRKAVTIGGEELAALAKIALAAKQAQPLAWTDREEVEEMQKGTYANMFNGKNIPTDDGKWFPLYTTPPLNPTEQHMMAPDGWVEFVANIADDSHMNNSLREWANRLLAAAPKPESE